MDVARSAPQRAHYNADVIYLLPRLGIKKGARALWYSEVSLHQLGSRSTVLIPRWTAHPCVCYVYVDAVQRSIKDFGQKTSFFGLAGSTINPILPSLSPVNNVHMVVDPLCRGPVNIRGFVVDGRIGYCSNTNCFW